jgi:hypothetical protein
MYIIPLTILMYIIPKPIPPEKLSRIKKRAALAARHRRDPGNTEMVYGSGKRGSFETRKR